MKLNTAVRKPKIFTHEGGRAVRINPVSQLRRTVLSCLLWEKEFYEDGQSIADRIAEGVKAVSPQVAADLAVEARTKGNLRHVPLLIATIMASLSTHKALVSELLEKIIQRADELTELLTIYWRNGKRPISSQIKKGLAKAFRKFDEFQLQKYNRDGAVKLRDVLMMVRPKPKDKKQEKLWKRLLENTLKTPDTWEVQLSAGKDKKATWERLLKEEKLGGLALLRNLRNMKEAGVNEQLIFNSLSAMKTERILPYRFIAAARYAPQWEDKIEVPMLACLKGAEKLPGKTVLLVDVSGSMDEAMSGKSEVLRVDAACGLAIILREVCENVTVYTFSNSLALVPSRRGFALRDAITGSQGHGGTNLGGAVEAVMEREKYDRLIVISDEQSNLMVPEPKGKAYMINVASAQNGVGYGKFIHIDGFSESVVDYICSLEQLEKLS